MNAFLRSAPNSLTKAITGNTRSNPVRGIMGKTTDRKKALEVFKPAIAVHHAEEDPVARNMAKQRAARVARDVSGHPPPEPAPGARVAKRRS